MTNEYLKIETVITDDFLKMIRANAVPVIQYCVDDFLQADCINCPYNMGKDIPCILSDYEELRLL